jgi:hypothetical protein
MRLSIGASLIVLAALVAGFAVVHDRTPAQGVSGGPAAAGCSDDGLEDNDTQGAPREISFPGFDQSLMSCGGDSDWYAIYLTAKTRINIDVLYSIAGGNVDVALYAPTGELLALATSGNDDDGISQLGPATGMYTLHVYTTAPPDGYKGNTYRLVLDGCLEDTFENNDSMAFPRAITLPYDESLRSCPDDNDWFSFNVPVGATAEINVEYIWANGDVDIYMRDAAGTVVASSVNVEQDNEHISYVSQAGGKYTVELRLFDGIPAVGNVYRLRIETIGGEPPPEPTATEQPPEPTATEPAPEPTDPPQDPTPTRTPEPKLLGDVNDDGRVDAIDAALILQFGAGIVGSLPNEDSGDVDENGRVDAIDAAIILQYTAGMVGTLPP